MRGRAVWAVTGVVVVAAIVGLWVFQPWRLWTRSEADEALPAGFTTSTGAAAVGGSGEASAGSAPAGTSSATVEQPTVLATGGFVTQEHETRGTATVLRSGAARVLRLEGFSTSDGPDLHIWLSDATAGGEWGKYDDGRYLPLGPMKATDGNQNYPIPEDVDLSGLRSVVVWCDRFNVAFGSAPLDL
ncbi:MULTISPECIES: DM13 domain-containing protein [Actinosynnema]|uniref:DM13 domain-containing protein n=1 Tax=Actinosynnema TaxID=40566 RepID=UPI0020A4D166|nr:DM13 domain-containing protein [Actinosynnema pretiosum]